MNELQDVNWGLIAPLIVIQLILAIVALIDLAKIYATRGPKWMWVPIILFIQLIGPVIYFIAGRKNS